MLPKIESLGVVVVCEDDAPTLELLCDHLQADSFEAVPAPCAADAVSYTHLTLPTILLV